MSDMPATSGSTDRHQHTVTTSGVVGGPRGSSPHLSVAIPAYRSENCITELVRRLQETLGAITPDYEIAFVGDAGGDGSWDIFSDLARRDPLCRSPGGSRE